MNGKGSIVAGSFVFGTLSFGIGLAVVLLTDQPPSLWLPGTLVVGLVGGFLVMTYLGR